MCAVLDVGVRRGFRFRSALWVAFMRIMYGSMTWGPFFTGYFWLQWVINPMYFCFAPVP